MAKKFNVSGEQHYGITGQILEIQKQIRLNGGSPLDPESVKLALQDIIENKFNNRNEFLRLISGGEKLIIKALNSKRIIAQAESIFKSYIDSDFVNFGLNKVMVATPEIPVEIYEVIEDATFEEIFGSLPGTLEEKCLLQNQIIEFCKTFPGCFAGGGAPTIFLCKKDEHKHVNAEKPKDNLVVVYVIVSPGGLEVYVEPLEYDRVWPLNDNPHVVVPQLMS